MLQQRLISNADMGKPSVFMLILWSLLAMSPAVLPITIEDS